MRASQGWVRNLLQVSRDRGGVQNGVPGERETKEGGVCQELRGQLAKVTVECRNMKDGLAAGIRPDQVFEGDKLLGKTIKGAVFRRLVKERVSQVGGGADNLGR